MIHRPGSHLGVFSFIVPEQQHPPLSGAQVWDSNCVIRKLLRSRRRDRQFNGWDFHDFDGLALFIHPDRDPLPERQPPE